MQKSEILALFESYMKITGVASLLPETAPEPALSGKSLGIVNGSSWVTLWSNYFGREYLPGIKLVNVGNEAVQLNFMYAHEQGLMCPPQQNIDLFSRYARDLCELYKPDAILLTCSTMNRSYPAVQQAVAPYGVPVVQIDQPMMEKAVSIGRNILIVCTHGPTIENTRMLLEETAAAMGKAGQIHYEGCASEEPFLLLGKGDIRGHNRLIGQVIRDAMKTTSIDCVVLAQLSMSVFKIEHPDAENMFGVPVLCSGEEGFLRVRELLTQEQKEGDAR